MKQKIRSCSSVLKRFHAFLKAGRLAHAYLFIGPKKCGKTTTALEIAKLVNCEKLEDSTPCGACSACIKIETCQHPDVQIFGQEKSLGIDDIRKLIGATQLRAYEAKRKVFIVRDAENLTIEAANALLKTLEEPAANSLIILTASKEENLLPTIRSRCQIINFFSLTSRTLKKILTNDYGQRNEVAHFLAFYSEGCLGKLDQEDFEGVFERKNEVIDQICFAFDCEPYFKGLLADKAKTKEAVYFLFCWFRDLLLVKSGAEEQFLIHFDRSKDLTRVASHYREEEIEDILNDILETSKAIDANFNVKVALALLKEKIWRK